MTQKLFLLTLGTLWAYALVQVNLGTWALLSGKSLFQFNAMEKVEASLDEVLPEVWEDQLVEGVQSEPRRVGVEKGEDTQMGESSLQGDESLLPTPENGSIGSDADWFSGSAE